MKEKGNLGQQLYTFAFMILAVKNILDSSLLWKRPAWMDSLFVLLFLGAMIGKLSLQIYNGKQVLIFACLGTLCIYTCFRMHYYYLIYSFLGIIAMQNVDLKYVTKYTSRTKTVLILFHVISYIIANVIHSSMVYLVVRNGVARHFFFLGHPNTFSMYVLWTSLEYLYSQYDNAKISKVLYIYVINLVTYYFTNSNTGLLVSTFVVAFVIFDKLKVKKAISLLNGLSKYTFSVCSILFPLSCVLYTKLSGTGMEIYKAINKLFTGRLLYGAYVYDNYGISLLGKAISFPKKSFWRGNWMDTMVFDNSYIWLFVLYGSIYLVILSIAFIVIAKKTTTEEKIFVTALAFYGIMEAYIINASAAFPLLIIGKYIYDKKSKRLAIKQ